MTTETIAQHTAAEVRSHSVRMAILQDAAFMAGVMEALQEESRGASGKTLEEIRKEHGLTH